MQQFSPEVLIVGAGPSGLTLAWEGSLLYDRDHSIHTHYGIHAPSLAFVRSDGYLGLLNQSVQERELIDYLQRIYLFSHEGSALPGKALYAM